MKTPCFFSLPALAVLCCLFACPAPAAGKSIELTVHAGNHDRTNTPVRLLIPVPAEAKSVRLTDADGNRLAAQLTAQGLIRDYTWGARPMQQLHFILPSLKKGKSMKLTATVSTDPPSTEGFVWKNTPGQSAELSYGTRPVLRYMCLPYDDSDPKSRHDTYKVFHHVYNPAGEQIITKGPGGKYTHHRGIFFGFSRVSYEGGGADIWHCKGNTHQSHAGFLGQEAGKVLGRHTAAVDWYGGDKRVFAKEQRELTVYKPPGGVLIEFASRLCSTGGKVKLDGDPQHAGFQFRASQKVADGDQKLTYYLRPDGKGQPGETRNWPGDKRMANLPWNAMSFVIDGKRYTALYLDKPSNPKEARYSERTYGRFGSYFVYELDDDKCLEVNYRIWLQDGEMTVEQAQALSDDFVEPVKVAVK